MPKLLLDPRSLDWQQLRTRKLVLLLSCSLVALLLASAMPPMLSLGLSCGMANGLALLRQRSGKSGPWWGAAGWLAGSFLGSAVAMADHVRNGVTHVPWERGFSVALLVLTGAIVGRCLGRQSSAAAQQSIGDVLRSTSGLFTGLFAVIVSASFVLYGLDHARTTSSRLSTSLTIIVLCLAAPGWLSHALQAQRRER
jgi:hypothetical protein